MGERGRPKGSKDSRPNPARRATAIANGNRPKALNDESAREELRAAKGKLARALSSRGTEWLLKIIDEGPPRWEFVGREGGGSERVLVSGSEQFEWAMNFAADRAGMPRRSEAEITQPGGFAIVVHDERGGLGWPGVAVGGGDRDDERSPLVAQ